MKGITNFIGKYWRGSCEFRVIAGLGLLFLCACLYFPFASTNREWAVLSIFGLGFTSFSTAIWLAVGAFRTGDRITHDSGSMMLVWAAFFLSILSPFGASIVTFQAVLRHSSMVQPIKPLVAPIIPLPISPDGQTVRLTGELDYPLRKRLLFTLSNNPSIVTVDLNSLGGNVFAARALVLDIAKHGLDTHVSEQCFSSCTLVFMAGSEHSLGPVGELGFHGYKFKGIERSNGTNQVRFVDLTEQENKDREYFQSKGVTLDFTDQIFSTPPSEIWIPSRNALREAHVLSE
ncbi:MAG: hypothetical protein P8Q99_08315 [Paracoccaceae bacterium]|nr:hypothetical protein [Paracoccaceae bacterium]